jgi:hypothetical protein
MNENQLTECDEDIELNDIWTYYFHDPNDENWTLGSYLRLHDMSTVKDYWNLNHVLKDKLKQGMFFLMREHIFPCWDDEFNINGGCLSIKVLKDNIIKFWEELSIRLLGENLLIEEHRDKWDMVNGISISPKKYFVICKIWMNTTEFNDKKFFNIPQNYYGDIIFRDNMENIQKSK